MALASAYDKRPDLTPLFASDAGARARAYRAALRHSRFVRVFRWALPLGSIAAVAALALGALAPWRALAPAQVTADSISADGASMTMAHPKLSGFRRDGRPFSLTADKAVQDLAQPSKAVLTGVSGQMSVSDSMTFRLQAGQGLYDNAAQSLSVTQNVRLSSDAFDLALESADIDFRSGAMRSDQKVIVHRRDGSQIVADSFAAADNGRQLTFSGHVRTTVQQADSGGAGDGR